MSNSYKGISASPGIAIGKAVLLQALDMTVDTFKIKKEDANVEIQKFDDAIKASRTQLLELVDSVSKSMGEDHAEIFKAHLDILDDIMIRESMENKIRNDCHNVQLALDETLKEILAIFESMEDGYLKERAADIKDVCGRVMQNLKGIPIVTLNNLQEESVVIAKDITPSDTATMDLDKVKGFATDLGGRTAHAAIMARSLELPAIVGMGDFFKHVNYGDIIILDALEGNAFINPDEATLLEYKDKQKVYEQRRKALQQLKDLPGETKDGHRVELCANIGSPKDLDGVKRNGAEGVGLYRTEFLYMDNDHFPTEDEQFDAYKVVLEQMEGKSVIIRTLDIGGDKTLSYYQFPEEMNPFLGWRALRISLDRTDLFKTQLRAILRASTYGKCRIMFPMIISLDEFLSSKKVLEECKEELRKEGVPFDEGIETGVMIETPAAVFIAEHLAKVVDFFSIGTNDLTQYTLAVDRGNEKISSLYNSFHPSVLAAIKKVIDASHKENKWTGMCGEFAGDEKATLLLLGMGLDEFSMSAPSIPVVKDIIRKSSFKYLEEKADQILSLPTSGEIEKAIHDMMVEMEIE